MRHTLSKKKVKTHINNMGPPCILCGKCVITPNSNVPGTNETVCLFHPSCILMLVIPVVEGKT